MTSVLLQDMVDRVEFNKLGSVDQLDRSTDF